MQDIYGIAGRTRGYYMEAVLQITSAVSYGPAFKFSGLNISSTKSVQ